MLTNTSSSWERGRAAVFLLPLTRCRPVPRLRGIASPRTVGYNDSAHHVPLIIADCPRARSPAGRGQLTAPTRRRGGMVHTSPAHLTQVARRATAPPDLGSSAMMQPPALLHIQPSSPHHTPSPLPVCSQASSTPLRPLSYLSSRRPPCRSSSPSFSPPCSPPCCWPRPRRRSTIRRSFRPSVGPRPPPTSSLVARTPPARTTSTRPPRHAPPCSSSAASSTTPVSIAHHHTSLLLPLPDLPAW